MNGVFYYPTGLKHHFRNILTKNGKADLKDDSGKIIFAGVPISTERKAGHVCIPEYKPEKAAKSAK